MAWGKRITVLKHDYITVSKAPYSDIVGTKFILCEDGYKFLMVVTKQGVSLIQIWGYEYLNERYRIVPLKCKNK